MSNYFQVPANLPLKVHLAGLQISRCTGEHLNRTTDFFDLLFVREGMLPIQEEHQAFNVVAGQTLLLWPHRHHWGTGKFSPDMRLYWLHFNIAEAKEFAGADRSLQQHPIDVPQYATVARPDVLESLFRRFLDDQATQRLLPHYASLLVNQMLCEIADQRSLGTENRQGAVLAGRALTYIRAHLHQPLTASSVAENLGYRTEYLNRIFHRTYHHTLTQEIHLSRMSYARYLLLHSGQNISEISLSCGLSDVNYFARLFKRYQGMTAMNYRQLYAQVNVNYE